MTNQTSLTDSITEIIRRRPGAKHRDLMAALPQTPSNHIAAIVSRLVRSRLAVRDRDGGVRLATPAERVEVGLDGVRVPKLTMSTGEAVVFCLQLAERLEAGQAGRAA